MAGEMSILCSFMGLSDTLDPRHFGTMTVRPQKLVQKCPDTSALVPKFTSAEMSVAYVGLLGRWLQ